MVTKIAPLSLILSTLLAGCFASPVALPAVAQAVPVASAATSVRVHQHASGDAAFNANAYLVETPSGVVAIDAPFTVSEAAAFRKQLDALHKPLLAVLITHAHPDHVNGITQLVQGQHAPVLALSSVDAVLRTIDGPKRAYWAPIYKAEYPATTTFPTRLVKAGETVSFGGVHFQALDLGAGESDDETIWVMNGKTAYVGDLVMNRTHPWLGDGHSRDWLKALDKAQALLKGVTTLYPGHGRVGTVEALAWQKGYIQTYRQHVQALADGQPSLTTAAKAELERRMTAYLPKAPLQVLIGMGADVVAGELAANH